MRAAAHAGWAAILAVGLAGPAAANGLIPFVVSGDAVAEALDGRTGDAGRGRAIVLDRQVGNCLICHQVPDEPGEAQQGTIGPTLTGVAGRLSTGQIRLRLMDQSRLNPRTVMPPYYRVDGLNRVAPQYRGLPVLNAQQIEDVVAYLGGLRTP